MPTENQTRADSRADCGGKKILIVACQGLPNPGQPATGGSLRTQALGRALSDRGHRVIYSVPRESIGTDTANGDRLRRDCHRGDDIDERIARIAPDIVLFGNWGLLSRTAPGDAPAIVDVNGSLILENHYRKRGWPISHDALSKIRALSRADLVLAGSSRQKAYLTAWCLLTGLDPEKIHIEVVPFSLGPQIPAPAAAVEPQFVVAGYDWPWLQGQAAVETVDRELEKLQRGRLLLYTAPPPYVDTLPAEDSGRDSTGGFVSAEMTRTKACGAIGFEQLTAELSACSVAVDIWDPNPERELAFPSRTVVYLWCGLPVITHPQGEIADLIARYRAGWLLEPGDEKGLRTLVNDIITAKVDLTAMRSNARRLAQEHFDRGRTIEPVHRFCCRPTINRVRPPPFTQMLQLQKDWEESRRSHRELQDAYGQLRTELEAANGINARLRTENRLLGIDRRRRSGASRLASARVFGVEVYRIFIGAPVMLYLFVLVSIGRVLQELHERWRRP